MLITAINALAIITAMCRPFAAPDGGGAGAGGQDPAGTGDPSGNANTPAGTDPQKNAEPTFDSYYRSNRRFVSGDSPHVSLNGLDISNGSEAEKYRLLPK